MPREIFSYPLVFCLGFFFQKKECDWLSENDKIEGFEWRGGSERVTSGIQIWSKPFEEYL